MRKKNILIAPSILSADLLNLRSELDAICEASADLIHIDVMDGHYVPNMTFGFPLIEAIKRHSSLPIDVHLMVKNPIDYIDRLADIGVNYISYHPGTVFHNHRMIYKIKEHKIKVGWALNPGDSVYLLEPVLNDLDFVLFMTVNPGYGGQSFISSVLSKIESFNKLKTLNICGENIFPLTQIDGGVNEKNAPILKDLGSDILVAGSYIFQGNNYADKINNLRNA